MILPQLRSKTLDVPTDFANEFMNCEILLERKHKGKKIRLIGVYFNFKITGIAQLSFLI